MGRPGRIASCRAAAVFAAATALAAAAAAAAGEVRVSEETRTIPTYEEGPPDPNPPFDLFTSGRFDYPYTMRENLTSRRSPREWRLLVLENEHLRVEVLPDLGGRLWRCVDKANGASLFYANPTLKFAQVAYRGSWATFGIEWNFPVSHNWVTSSPVDWATVRHEDGSASVVVGNVDLVYGMQWRVALTLRPGRAALEQDTTLYNRSDLPHRFYWWTNAAVEVWDDSRILYPIDFTAAHGFAEVDTWPVTAKGVDLSLVGNHTFGPVSLFAHGSREGFMGIYHPRTRAGVAHYADPAELPAKKVWSWGGDADGLDWRKALSDDGSAEAEIQAGLFRDQETYAFLAPQEEVRFHETWLPVREIGGFSRVTPDAVLNVQREPSGALRVGLNVSESLRAGVVRVLDGTKLLHDERLSLEPSSSFSRAFAGLFAAERYTVEVADGARSRARPPHRGRVRQRCRARRSCSDRRRRGGARRRRSARTTTSSSSAAARSSTASSSSPTRRTRTVGAASRASFALGKAAGRLAVALKRYDDAVDRLLPVEARATQDPEIAYALGLALVARDDTAKARPRLELAARARATRPAALLQLARLDASRRTHGYRARPAAHGHGRVARDGPRGRPRGRAPPSRRPSRGGASSPLPLARRRPDERNPAARERAPRRRRPRPSRPPRRRAAADPRRGRRLDVGRRARRRARAPVAHVAEGRRLRRAGSRCGPRATPSWRTTARTARRGRARTRAWSTTRRRGCRRRTSSRTARSRCRSSSGRWR